MPYRWLNRFLRQAVLSLREALLISVIDAGASLALFLIWGIGIIDSYGLIVLLESAVLMLVGSALSFAGQGGVRVIVDSFAKKVVGKRLSPGKEELERNELRAALYAITGGLLFVEGIVLTAILS